MYNSAIKKNFLFPIVLTFIPFSNDALAGDKNINNNIRGNYYLSLSAGYTEAPDAIFIFGEPGRFEYEGNFSGELALGCDFGKWRYEIAYTKTHTKKTGHVLRGSKSNYIFGDVDYSNIVFNVYRDLQLKKSKFTPYIGLGMGFSTVEYGKELFENGMEHPSNKSGSLIGQIKVGTDYKMSDKFDLFLEGNSAVYSKSNYYPFTGGLPAETYNSNYGLKIGLKYHL